MHGIESRFVIGPLNILFAGVHLCGTLQPGNFTGRGSEGVKYAPKTHQFSSLDFECLRVWVRSYVLEVVRKMTNVVLQCVYLISRSLCPRLCIYFVDLVDSVLCASGSR